MTTALDYSKLPTGGHITFTWLAAGGITDVDDPTITQLNAGINLSKAASISDTDFGNQASNTNSDPSFADEGNVQDRGASQYGGSISFYYPRSYDDSSNVYSNVYDALDQPRTPGFIAMRVDGDTKNDTAYAAGQYVSVYEVITDGETNSLGGEEAQKRAVNFLSRGNLATYTVTRSGAAALVIPTTLSGDVSDGDKGRLSTTLNGRPFYGADYSSSNPAVVEIIPGGFWRAVGAGSATITATYNGLSDTCAATITA